MVGLGDELSGAERTCAAAKGSENNDWGAVAGSRGRELRGRALAETRFVSLGVDNDQVRLLRCGDLRPPLGPGGFEHLGALAFKEGAEQVARLARTIDNEHARRRGQRRVSVA